MPNPNVIKRLHSRLDGWWTPKPDGHTVALWLFDEPLYLNQALYDAGSHWYNLNLQPRLKPDVADYRTDHHATIGPGKFGNAIVRQKPGLAADTREELAFPSQSDWTWEFWLRAVKPPSDKAFVFDTTTGRERCILSRGGAILAFGFQEHRAGRHRPRRRGAI